MKNNTTRRYGIKSDSLKWKRYRKTQITQDIVEYFIPHVEIEKY